MINSGAPSSIGTRNTALIRPANAVMNVPRVSSGTELYRYSRDIGELKNLFDGAFFPVGVSDD
jgi:hypothetical protein